MSTVITKVLHKLRAGKSEAGRITVDDRGRNVWEWNDPDVNQAGTTTLLRRLDTTSLGMADTQVWNRQELESAHETGGSDDSCNDIPVPELSIEDTRRSPAIDTTDRRRKGHIGRKTDAGGGFNPYG